MSLAVDAREAGILEQRSIGVTVAFRLAEDKTLEDLRDFVLAEDADWRLGGF
jgi:hypothetical protein